MAKGDGQKPESRKLAAEKPLQQRGGISKNQRVGGSRQKTRPTYCVLHGVEMVMVMRVRENGSRFEWHCEPCGGPMITTGGAKR